MTEVLDQRIAEKLARVLGMLGSAHDGERASAAALADKLIRAQGLTWSEIILSRPERITTIESEIDFALANGAGVLSAWEEGFLRGIRGRDCLTQKQLAKLGDIVAKVRAYYGEVGA
jgi:hypothetical protein